jgi:hypothetical protein
MSLATLRRRSRLLRDLTTLVLVLLVLTMGLQIALVLRAGVGEDLGSRILAMKAPLLLYVAAVWMVRGAFAQLARGSWFTQVLPRLLSRLGLCLFAGGVTEVFIVPQVLAFMTNGRPIPFAFFEPAAVTLGVVGAMLVMIGRLLAQAADMQAELDEIL